MLMAASCNVSERKPAGILTQEQMVLTLADLYVAEEKVSRLGLSKDSAEMVFRIMEGKVFDSLKIHDSVFRASQDYYLDHPKEMEAIYSALVDSLQLREQRTSFKLEE